MGGKQPCFFKETRSNLVIFTCCMDYSLASFPSYFFSELTELMLCPFFARDAGDFPFELRAVQKDGLTCAWCPWYR